MKLMTNGRKTLLAALALVGCFGFAFNAQAQCVVSNWTSQTGLVDGDAGTQSSANRRYGGPCGLRVDLDSTARYLTDASPGNETTYIARFYAFLDNAGTAPVRIFEASDGTTNQIEVWYNQTAAGELNMLVGTSGGGSTNLNWGAVGSGWHSIELVWTQGAASTIVLNVDGGTDLTATVDTGGITIADAAIGNLNGANTGGSIDFDDFDSRRVERPGRLMVGDANADASVNVFDIVASIDEIQSGVFAPGQPDCDENGTINVFDIVCQIDIIQ